MSIDLKKLAEPFDRVDIDWRIQESGKGGGGKIWAKCLAYLTNRAIMQRLDDVCGPENWRNEYHAGPAGGVLCTIYIKIGGEWVGKSDGADNTDIEKVKGGLSGSMKRAAVQWGIGRYLYHLDVYFAQIVEKCDGAFYAKLPRDKGGDVYYWMPPQLPVGALSPAERDKLVGKGEEVPNGEPANGKKPNGRTPSKRSGNDTPANASSDCAKALSAIRNCFDLRKLQRYQDEIRQRIENGATYTADDVKLLEAAIAEAEQRLNAKRAPAGADEPDPVWLKSTAKELGCPADMLEMMAIVSAKQANPAEYLATRPWLEAAAT